MANLIGADSLKLGGSTVAKAYYGSNQIWPVGSPPTFAPDDLTDLLAWYDADDASTFTYSSGTRVSQWDNKSGQVGAWGNLTQAATGDQPTRSTSVLNGKAGVYFDIMDTCYMELLGSGSPWPATFFFVHRILDSIHVNAALWSIDQTTSDYQISRSASLGTEFDYQFSGRDTIQLFNGEAVNQNLIFAGRFDTGPNLSHAYLNGSTNSISTTLQSHTGGLDFYLNANRSTGRTPESYHHEVLVYDRVLTASETNQVGNYLAAKWGLTWSDIS